MRRGGLIVWDKVFSFKFSVFRWAAQTGRCSVRAILIQLNRLVGNSQSNALRSGTGDEVAPPIAQPFMAGNHAIRIPKSGRDDRTVLSFLRYLRHGPNVNPAANGNSQSNALRSGTGDEASPTTLCDGGVAATFCDGASQPRGYRMVSTGMRSGWFWPSCRRAALV